MAETVQRVEREYDTEAGMPRKTVITKSPAKSRSSFVAARVVWFIAGVIITLLAFRFVLVLLGANRGSAFVDFMYSVSYPFAAPFFGMFNYDLKYGVSRLELSTLVAIAVYALIAWGIAYLVTIRDRR